MKYVNEYRNFSTVQKMQEALHRATKHPWTIMEVCGGQTHTIMKFSLHELLPKQIRLVHGPGCPICVTPLDLIDQALAIASQSGAIFCSFADMGRVPGSNGDLLTARARGADVRLVNSPLEAVEIAKRHPDKEVVFFAVGFETTAPPNAMAVIQAKRLGLKNFSLLASHVLVPPALKYLLSSPDLEVQGFVAAGHVCTITGYTQYHPLARDYRMPIVVTGFEPFDLLHGLYLCVQMLEEGRYGVTNQYTRCVQEVGNLAAQAVLNEVFTVVDRDFRGIGMVPKGGLALKQNYAEYDAALRFPMLHTQPLQENGCISGLILQGKKKPCDCPLFNAQCTPEHPLGAPMVSNEGACCAYHRYFESTRIS